MVLKYLLFASVIWLYGCATGPITPIQPQKAFAFLPENTDVHVASIGEEILSLESYLIYPAIELHTDISGGDGGFLIKCTVPKQVLVAAFQDDVWVYYPGKNVTDYDLIASNVVRGGVKLKKNVLDPVTGKNEAAIYCRTTGVTRAINEEMSFEWGEYTATDKNGSHKSLVYNGRNNQELFLSYYSVQGAGQVIRKTIIHDVADSNVISVNEAKIEILNINDSAIEYRVLEGFSNDDW